MARPPPIERRILGVLVEKQKTSKTADSYPLTLNALVTGCNQKSNRDPVLDLDEVEVEEGLTGCKTRGWSSASRAGGPSGSGTGFTTCGRGTGRNWRCSRNSLLRGPQTRGDLRGRAGRMDAIDTLDALDGILKPLAARRLVVFLTDPERRGALVTHGFHSLDELARLRSHAPVTLDAHTAAVAPPAPTESPETKLAAVLVELDSLKARTVVLENEVAGLKKQLGLPNES